MTDRRGVSIVVPVFNRATSTYQCLKSIVARTAPNLYEIIVVDNASSDDTGTLLARAHGLRVIRNEVNRGFVEACNQGASQALGDFLLFLNNDVVVLDGWLEPLLETLGRDPTIGAVGPQLLYPDGRLQDAGSIIWNDGTGWQYGRDDDPLRPEYQHLREVDYCSAACLLVRRELFERLGGFDLRFAPAYYEDTDLCFALRRLGYRVMYQPGARVVHAEGATAGTDPTSGFKRFQALHRPIFVQKHAATLARHYPPDPRFLFRARDRRPGKRILIVDHGVPRYDQDSSGVRWLGILRILGELGHKVTFVGDDLELPEPYTGTLRQLGVEVLGGPLSIPGYIEQRLGDFDLIILCRALIGAKYLPAIAARPDHPPLIFDSVDPYHLRELRRADLERDPTIAADSAAVTTAERFLIRKSRVTWAAGPHEAALLRSDMPSARIEIVPIIHTVRPTVPPFADRQDLMFIGDFGHPSNEDAVLHFVQEIFPRIRCQIPGVRFRVAGPSPPPAIRALASADVEILGFVNDPVPLFDASRVFVAPLRYGGGKGKIGQSLACGLPVVTTTIGAGGLALANREQALIADIPEAFADGVVELYRDQTLWARLSVQGRQHVDTYYGYETVKARLDRLVSTVVT